MDSDYNVGAAYKQEKYTKFGPEHFAEASRQAVIDMIADINSCIINEKRNCSEKYCNQKSCTTAE